MIGSEPRAPRPPDLGGIVFTVMVGGTIVMWFAWWVYMGVHHG